jgi:aminoglycoside 3-N-acetyltransferase
MLRRFLSKLTPEQKSRVRGWYHKGKVQLVHHFRSYDAAALKNYLSSLGISNGDTLLVHTAYGPLLGFQGSPNALIDTFLEAIGPEGNLLMVSIPYLSSTADYLDKSPVFDVRKTVSKMGLVSETFRRKPGVFRSLHPTHSMLAYGPRAEWIVADHEKCLYSCGSGTPYEKLLHLNGKVLFFGVTEFHFTFHHYLEDLIKDELPFALYEAQARTVPVIDEHGTTRSVKTFIFTREAITRRRVHILFDELTRRGEMTKARIGNTRIVLMRAADTVARTKELARNGIYFYDLSGSGGN